MKTTKDFFNLLQIEKFEKYQLTLSFDEDYIERDNLMHYNGNLRPFP